jgi:hypothetical protein
MQTLEQWLSVATRGLCDAAAARVRAEIGEHYASALESAGTADVDPLDVERRAVTALGDAKTANRQYRRVLLTEGEDVLLRGLSPLSQFWDMVTAGSLVMVGALIWVRTSEFRYLPATVIVEVMLRAIPVGSIRAGSIVRSARWGVLTIGLTMTVVSYLGPGIAPIFHVTGVVLVAVAAGYAEYKFFVLRRKVPVEQWPRRLKV